MAKVEPKLDNVDILFIGGLAVLFDILSIIPFLGSLGMGALRLIFSMKGLDTGAINMMFAVGALAEAIPVVSLLPSCIVFVMVAIWVDRVEARTATDRSNAAEAVAAEEGGSIVAAGVDGEEQEAT